MTPPPVTEPYLPQTGEELQFADEPCFTDSLEIVSRDTTTEKLLTCIQSFAHVIRLKGKLSGLTR